LRDMERGRNARDLAKFAQAHDDAQVRQLEAAAKEPFDRIAATRTLEAGADRHCDDGGASSVQRPYMPAHLAKVLHYDPRRVAGGQDVGVVVVSVGILDAAS
jgi:hypothetical protein